MGKDVVQPPPLFTACTEAALNSETTLTNAGLTLVICSANPTPCAVPKFFRFSLRRYSISWNPASCCALLCRTYSYSAHLHCRPRYSHRFPLCNRFSPAAVSEHAQEKLFHSCTAWPGLLSRSCSDCSALHSSFPLLIYIVAWVQILHPGASGVGLSHPTYRQPGTKLTYDTWIYFLLCQRENWQTQRSLHLPHIVYISILHWLWNIEKGNDEDKPLR